MGPHIFFKNEKKEGNSEEVNKEIAISHLGLLRAKYETKHSETNKFNKSVIDL